MSYTAQEGRGRILDELADATDRIALALALVGEAYERLDDDSGDRLEAALFRPLSHALGAAQRTHTGFARRHGLGERTFAAPSAGPASQDARVLVERATDASQAAATQLAELQDTMLPVEVGDAELRAGLAEVRERLDALPGPARTFLRGLGR